MNNIKGLSSLELGILESISPLEGLIIEVVGAWIWVDGDTKQHKDILKSKGFFWASKKKKWYFRSEENKVNGRGKKSYEEIKEKYGVNKIK